MAVYEFASRLAALQVFSGPSDNRAEFVTYRWDGSTNFRSRTPAPSPFSGMKITPASSRAACRARRFARMGDEAPRSKFLIVLTATSDASAKRVWLIDRRALAARHCSGVMSPI